MVSGHCNTWYVYFSQSNGGVSKKRNFHAHIEKEFKKENKKSCPDLLGSRVLLITEGGLDILRPLGTSRGRGHSTTHRSGRDRLQFAGLTTDGDKTNGRFL